MEWSNSNPDVYRRKVEDNNGEPWDVIYSVLDELAIAPSGYPRKDVLELSPHRNIRIFADRIRVFGKVESRGIETKHASATPPPGGQIEIVARTIVAGSKDACLSVQPEDGPSGPFTAKPNTDQSKAADFSDWPGGNAALLGIRYKYPTARNGTNFDCAFGGLANWGSDGKPGCEGAVGAKGGRIVLTLDHLPDESEAGFVLTLSAKGGMGGQGQDGQDGAYGKPGTKVYITSFTDSDSLEDPPYSDRNGKGQPASAVVPGKGGNGGDAGPGGCGGAGGQVTLCLGKRLTKRVATRDLIDKCFRIVVDPGEPGLPGKPGKPGQISSPELFASFVRNLNKAMKCVKEGWDWIGYTEDNWLRTKLLAFFAEHTHAGVVPKTGQSQPGTHMVSIATDPEFVARHFPPLLLDKLYQRARLQTLRGDPFGAAEEARTAEPRTAASRAIETLDWLAINLEPIRDSADVEFFRQKLIYQEANSFYNLILTGTGPYGVRSNYVPRLSIERFEDDLEGMASYFGATETLFKSIADEKASADEIRQKRADSKELLKVRLSAIAGKIEEAKKRIEEADERLELALPMLEKTTGWARSELAALQAHVKDYFDLNCEALFKALEMIAFDPENLAMAGVQGAKFFYDSMTEVTGDDGKRVNKNFLIGKIVRFQKDARGALKSAFDEDWVEKPDGSIELKSSEQDMATVLLQDIDDLKKTFDNFTKPFGEDVQNLDQVTDRFQSVLEERAQALAEYNAAAKCLFAACAKRKSVRDEIASIDREESDASEPTLSRAVAYYGRLYQEAREEALEQLFNAHRALSFWSLKRGLPGLGVSI